MQFKKKLIYSALVSSAALLASIVLNITPCKTAPAVPNPVHKWRLCTLNPDQVSSLYSIKEYFGYTSSLSEAYAITIIVSFLVSFFVLYFFGRSKSKE
jgi:hypothetical protein